MPLAPYLAPGGMDFFIVNNDDTRARSLIEPVGGGVLAAPGFGGGFTVVHSPPPLLAVLAGSGGIGLAVGSLLASSTPSPHRRRGEGLPRMPPPCRPCQSPRIGAIFRGPPVVPRGPLAVGTGGGLPGTRPGGYQHRG